MAINETKLEGYAKKIYEGDLKRFKEKQKTDASFKFDFYLKQESKATKEKRVALSSPQQKTVIAKCKMCVTCGKKYVDPDDFAIHHVNGDPSHTVTSNLVVLCHGCHKKVHTRALSKLKDYKVNNKSTPTKKDNSPFGLTFTSPFETDLKKKSMKKKEVEDFGIFKL